MNRVHRIGLTGLALLLGGSAAWAQLPQLPVGVATPASVAPAAGPTAAVAADPAAVGPTVIKPGILQKIWARLTAARRTLCASPAGQLLNGATKPLSAMTGGVIPQFCPQTITDADMKKPGVAGAANAAKKEAMEAKQRQAAIRYLGTLDCRYYPDAVGALVAGLRTDGSECVRFEAAQQLGRGCCCSQKTIAALEATVAGTEIDGNPAERSVRVRCAAAVALERCLSCYVPPPAEPEEPKGGEKPPMGEQKPDSDKKDDGVKIPQVRAESKLPSAAQVDRAKRTLAVFHQQLAAALPTLRQQGVAVPTDNSLFAIVKSVVGNDDAAALEQTRSTQAAPVMAALPAPAKLPAPSLMPTPAVQASMPARLPVAMPSLPTPMIPPATPEPIAPATLIPSPPAPVPVPQATAPMMPAAPIEVVRAEEPKPMMPEPAIVIPQLATTPDPAPVSNPESQRVEVPTPRLVLPDQDSAGSKSDTLATEQVAELVKKLESAQSSAEKHTAIRELVKHNWKKHAKIVPAIMNMVKNDCDRIVRVDGIRHLAAYHMTDPVAVALLKDTATDADEWVANEANEAVCKLESLCK